MAAASHTGGCVRSLTSHVCNLFPPSRTLPSPGAPYPTPPNPSWAASLGLPAAAVAPRHQSHSCWELKTRDKYRPGRAAPPPRAGNPGLRVPLPLPGVLPLLQYPYKGNAKSTIRLTKKMYIFPRLDADFSPTARESTSPLHSRFCFLFPILNKQNPKPLIGSDHLAESVFRGKGVEKGVPGAQDAPKLLERVGGGGRQPASRCGPELSPPRRLPLSSLRHPRLLPLLSLGCCHVGGTVP